MGYGGIPVTYNMKMRDSLPVLTPENQSFSVWSILKGAIGKDMTKITMPIWLNEPISMLQKIAEITSFHKLMDRAVAEKDPVKRTAFVAIFLISQYTEVYLRTRKPFNPLLGETYEVVTPDFRFVAEQVSHHPPVSAFFFDGPGYQMSGDTVVNSFFKGTSLEFRAVGLHHVILTETNEQLLFKRPDNSANNLLMGNLYVDVHGELEVRNVTRGINVVVNISRQGMFTS